MSVLVTAGDSPTKQPFSCDWSLKRIPWWQESGTVIDGSAEAVVVKVYNELVHVLGYCCVGFLPLRLCRLKWSLLFSESSGSC